MDFSVGDTLRVDGDIYDIIGKIQYKNIKDNCCWYEYRMKSRGFSREKWLSFDITYREYSLSEVAFSASTNGYHIVDEGEEEVIGAWGDVDVEVGDRASFQEYEDRTEEKIISKEIWDDGEEISVGYYLDLDEVSIYNEGAYGNSYSDGGFGGNYSNSYTAGTTRFGGKKKSTIAWLVLILVFYFGASAVAGSGISIGSNSIAKYLKNSPHYAYETSITGNEKQNADVYKSYLPDVDTVAKDIINNIDGNTESVQQNTEDGDNSIAILTKKEYCLVYQSEDNAILVQVSSRKYAYTTDKAPYRSRRNTHRYFRRYYYSKGYYNDAGSFSKYTSPYSSFDDTTVDSNSFDTYNTYSSSVRQSSVNSRTSSGGGLSSGK